MGRPLNITAQINHRVGEINAVRPSYGARHDPEVPKHSFKATKRKSKKKKDGSDTIWFSCPNYESPMFCSFKDDKSPSGAVGAERERADSGSFELEMGRAFLEFLLNRKDCTACPIGDMESSREKLAEGRWPPSTLSLFPCLGKKIRGRGLNGRRFSDKPGFPAQ